jgi:hypothetical protein
MPAPSPELALLLPVLEVEFPGIPHGPVPLRGGWAVTTLGRGLEGDGERERGREMTDSMSRSREVGLGLVVVVARETGLLLDLDGRDCVVIVGVHSESRHRG